MKRIFKIALCQVNPTVGDLKGNRDKVLSFYRKALRHRPDLVAFPELTLTGYPPEDLLLRPSFLRSAQAELKTLEDAVEDPPCLLGSALVEKGKVYNGAALIQGRRTVFTYYKQCLPNYGVFDEKRYFSAGKELGVVRLQGFRLGISICEDIWEEGPSRNPCLRQARSGAQALLNISASPYHAGKFELRRRLLQRRARQARRPILYLNMVGGQDELLFDGRTLAVDEKGRLKMRAKAFQETLETASLEWDSGKPARLTEERIEPALGSVEEVFQALALGTRDYVDKNGFRRVLVGLSGGIDSALTAALAVEALGRDRVIGVTMPSVYSSRATRSDAARLAQNLGIRFLTVPIQSIFREYLKVLSPHFRSVPANIAEENLQSRIRGTLLMALSNKWGDLVLTTGNKSEVSVGYSTLYGDTAGGFAVIKDVPKTLVYRLCEFYNRKEGRAVIPRSTIRRAPTAELKPGQKDRDTLPPYPVLDRIVQGYVEEDRGAEELSREEIPPETLRRVVRMIQTNEYKRRQTPPGIKITPKAFGRDRRMPITNRFTEL